MVTGAEETVRLALDDSVVSVAGLQDDEMVSAKPWTIDRLLTEAKRLNKVVTPLFEWHDLRQVIQTMQLQVLRRHPSIEVLYTSCFNPLVKQTYGSTELYLRAQLGWHSSAETTGIVNHETEWWTSTDQAVLRQNDWAYSVPNKVQHYVVWVQKPLFHPALCVQDTETDNVKPQIDVQEQTNTFSGAESLLTPPGTPTKERGEELTCDQERDTWPFVLRYGLGGETGFGLDQKGTQSGPGREIDAFVRRTWSEDEFETLWFANPPTLQSVPGLAHFHVLVRHRGPGTSWEERDA
ncbi:hypothetical protein OIV83_002764 [Microbotryomycetes sp. JL201]|nr:hypothetical protein OIV83_002764 [Microbotryomycetes sp. JL201]